MIGLIASNTTLDRVKRVSVSVFVTLCVILYLQPSQCCRCSEAVSLFMERKRNTPTLLNKTHLSSVLFFMLSISTLIFNTTSVTASAIPCLDTRCPMNAEVDINFQKVKREIGEAVMVSRGKIEVSSMEEWPRRLLGGPGSSPPQCTTKCGKCTPCKPVHVPVPPGTPVTAEYYPEAWRCKCGNKLYMP